MADYQSQMVILRIILANTRDAEEKSLSSYPRAFSHYQFTVKCIRANLSTKH